MKIEIHFFKFGQSIVVEHYQLLFVLGRAIFDIVRVASIKRFVLHYFLAAWNKQLCVNKMRTTIIIGVMR